MGNRKKSVQGQAVQHLDKGDASSSRKASKAFRERDLFRRASAEDIFGSRRWVPLLGVSTAVGSWHTSTSGPMIQRQRQAGDPRIGMPSHRRYEWTVRDHDMVGSHGNGERRVQTVIGRVIDCQRDVQGNRVQAHVRRPGGLDSRLKQIEAVAGLGRCPGRPLRRALR